MTASTPEAVTVGSMTFPRMGFGTMRLAGPGIIGLPHDPTRAMTVLRHAVDRGEWVVDGRPQTIRQQVEDSLLDMRTDRSRLTYLRLSGDSDERSTTTEHDVPLAESLGALVELREEGKVEHIALSGATLDLLEQARRVTPITAVQNRYNVIDRSGVEVLATCERDGIAFVPYFPLATGVDLTHLDAVSAPSRRLGVSPSLVALAWLLRRSPVVLPIPGTTSTAHLDENLRAPSIASLLTDAEVDTLTAVMDEARAPRHGVR